MWAKSDAFHSACWTLVLGPSCRPRLAGLLNDGTLRAYNSSTLHRLQLVWLSTVFEFDGYSNNIPSLSCHSGQKELQINNQQQGVDGTTNTSSFGRWIISLLLVKMEGMNSRLLEAPVTGLSVSTWRPELLLGVTLYNPMLKIWASSERTQLIWCSRHHHNLRVGSQSS